MISHTLVVLLLTQTPPASSAAAPSDDIAEAYVARCSGCHTVGGGALKGPDLAASTQWPRASLRLAVAKMEKNVGAMTDSELDAFTDFLLSPELRPRLEAARAAAAQKLQAKLDPPSASTGEALFEGITRLDGGGPACSACHRVAGIGGALGPDLTHLSGKMDEIGMVSAFQGANFPVMRAAYAGRAVTAQEAVHLAAYVRSKKDSEVQTGPYSLVIGAGVGLGLATFAALAALLRPRRRQSDRNLDLGRSNQ
ncbi:MAG: cytochrome c [Myxococcales bacterium]|nr:cytochrome c [Myxococcales bacterium]